MIYTCRASMPIAFIIITTTINITTIIIAVVVIAVDIAILVRYCTL